ncbi:hypothetical protein J2X68_007561 [Streptomyces sp. 3330]|uniref:hypothetical protein n=1 Tax=Streptomyces sp. 3330 TaxID=2817755 RepID=UPI002860F511|nr:hypothetical protein [Streptomyces sp. 3330]MDR6980819.1 hypothetical protein [Streptomyces sp. 3330]
MLPPTQPAKFSQSGYKVPEGSVQSNMGDLAGRIRNLMALQQGQATRIPLGGALFDIVVTANGIDAYTAVTRMDEVQREQGGPVIACSPVIEARDQGCLFWLVPPGTSQTGEPHLYGVCLGRPHQMPLPAMACTQPPEPYWLRPLRGDRLVPPGPLRDLLARHRPGLVPHEALPDLLSAASF